jgi:geranylgeranyl pyrophosphate synthase
MDCPSYAKPLWEYGMVLGEIYQTLDDLKDLLHADPTKPSVDERNQTPTLLTFLKKEKIPLSSYFLPHRESLQNPPLPSIPSVVERVLQEFEKYAQQIPSYGKEVME